MSSRTKLQRPEGRAEVGGEAMTVCNGMMILSS